jgi:hypothetical protein
MPLTMPHKNLNYYSIKLKTFYLDVVSLNFSNDKLTGDVISGMRRRLTRQMTTRISEAGEKRD